MTNTGDGDCSSIWGGPGPASIAQPTNRKPSWSHTVPAGHELRSGLFLEPIGGIPNGELWSTDPSMDDTASPGKEVRRTPCAEVNIQRSGRRGPSGSPWSGE